MIGSGKAAPLVSIIMPVLNSAATIKAAIRSVQLQTHASWELIIIDDGSTDTTGDIVRQMADPRIDYISDGLHKGLARRLNEGVRRARGSYIARMDADDISYPTRLESQIEYLVGHPDVDLVGAAVLVFGDHGRVAGKRFSEMRSKWLYRFRIRTVPIAHPTFFGHIRWFRTHPYPEWADYFEDQQLLVSSLDDCHMAVIPRILLGYRGARLSARKLLRSRLSQVRTLWRIGESSGMGPAIVNTVLQLGKMGVEIPLLVGGLEGKLLRHRTGKASSSEEEEWRAVWEMVTAE